MQQVCTVQGVPSQSSVVGMSLSWSLKSTTASVDTVKLPRHLGWPRTAPWSLFIRDLEEEEGDTSMY